MSLESKVLKISDPDRKRSSNFTMISAQKATDMLSFVTKLYVRKSMEIPIEDALGLVCYKDVFARFGFPKFRCSRVDGYAISSNCDSYGRQMSLMTGSYLVVGETTPGIMAIDQIKQKECIKVSTGASVSNSAYKIVPVESSILLEKNDKNEETRVQLNCYGTNNNIREPNTDFEKNDQIVIGGKPITATEIGLLASNGYATVEVFKSVTVGIFSTGNELIDIQDNTISESIINDPKSTKIFDCNRYILKVLLKKLGCEVEDFGIVPDDPNKILNVFQKGFEKCDIMISSGSVSMGEQDYIKRVLVEDLNAAILFGRVAIKPGKPTTFATCFCNNKINPVFCLPGNPLSVFVTFHVLVVPFLKKLQGFDDFELEQKDVWNEKMKSSDKERDEYLCVKLIKSDDKICAESCGGPQVSSRLLDSINADALLILPASDGSEFQPGFAKAIILN